MGRSVDEWGICKGCEHEFDKTHSKQEYCIACNFLMVINK